MSSQRGSSLIEVVVASAVLTAGILGVATMFPTAYMTLDRSGEQTAAIVLAEQQVEWLRSQPYAGLTTATTADNLDGEYTGFVRTTQIQVDTPEAGVTLVKVTVTSPGGYTVRELTSVITD